MNDVNLIVSIAFFIFSIGYCYKSGRELEAGLNADIRHSDVREDLDYERMTAEAEKYGYEGSRLQKYIARRSH